MDKWLIKNCPINFIQSRLKEQYKSDYDVIKNGNNCKVYKRDRLGKNIHFKIIKNHILIIDLILYIMIDKIKSEYIKKIERVYGR